MLPKSTHRERIEENAQIFDFALSDEDMAELDALDRTGGTDRGPRTALVVSGQLGGRVVLRVSCASSSKSDAMSRRS